MSFKSQVDDLYKDSAIIGQVVNGDATTTIQTDNGPIPSVRKAFADNFFFKDPIDWQPNSSNTDWQVPRKFTDGSFWWSPTATESTPVNLGSTPIGDDNWKVWVTGNSSDYVKQSQDNMMGYTYKGDYIAGIKLATSSDYVWYSGKRWFKKKPGPYTTGVLTPDLDVNLSDNPNGDSLYITTTGSNTARSLADRFADIVNVKDFGAIGDGIADDTAAIQAAIYSGKTVIFTGGTYRVSSATLKITTSIIGFQKPVIQFIGRRDDFATVMSDVKIEGMVFKGGAEDFKDTTESNYGAIKVPAGQRGVRFIDCEFTDMVGKQYGGQYAVRVSADSAEVEFIDCYFARIKSYGTNPPQEGTAPGFCGGINYGDETDVTSMSAMRVINCKFEDIETIRHPDASKTAPLDFDADAIRLYAPQTDYELTPRANVEVIDCKFINVQKRCIKNTGVDGLVVDGLDVTAFNTSDSTRPAMGAIVSLQPAKSASITNVRANGRFIYGFRVSCSDTIIKNVTFDKRYSGYGLYFVGLEDRTSLLEQEITVDNCIIHGFDTLIRSITLSPGVGSYDLHNVKFSNIDFGYWPNSASAIDYLVNVGDVDDLELSNIHFWSLSNGGGTIDKEGFLFNRCEDVLLDNVKMSADTKGITVTNTGSGTKSSKNFTIRNSEFSRAMYTEALVESFLDFHDPSVINVDIRNTDLITKSYAVNSGNNKSMVRIESDGAHLENIYVTTEPKDGSDFLSFGQITLSNASDAFIKGCVFDNKVADASILLELIGVSASGHRVIDCHSNSQLMAGTTEGQYTLMVNCTAEQTLGETYFKIAQNNVEY